jgi:hypothetical protein
MSEPVTPLFVLLKVSDILLMGGMSRLNAHRYHNVSKANND